MAYFGGSKEERNVRNYVAERAGPLALIGRPDRGDGRVPNLRWLIWETIAQSGAFDEELGMCFEDGPSEVVPEPMEPSWESSDDSGEWY